ncbi:hypothetical protein GV829_13130 [Sphingomonas lacunae]|uniref:Uncharacterized protein n=1 Tax=Sphingomonas lacunae TaxID=2698828 RepID=A0A6M4AVV1_9SPHN|nr:hypothetical protein [Sphingomonas lacunae]QJQ33263.1 hypothetical protein GV829_13130 [Sphingomonas lacunae]
MNAPLHHPLHGSTGPVEPAEAAIGRLIVATAAFEAKLTLLMRVLDPAANPRLMPSQKIRAILDLLSAKQSSGLQQRQQGRVAIILAEADKLLALRRECAHSTATQLEIDGETHWLLRNAQTASDPLDRCVLVSKAQMAAATGRIKQLTHQLGQILNPPLPRPPAPDATAGP